MNDSVTNVKLVVAARLTALKGFQNMGDIVPLVFELQNQGINAVGEAAPGAPIDGAPVFYIKVPESQLDGARQLLLDNHPHIFSKA